MFERCDKRRNEMRLTIECEMNDRWMPHFLAMLKTMQRLGSIGSSRIVGMFADGDGDFRPEFTIKEPPVVVPLEVNPVYNDDCKTKDAKCDYFFDAG